jgi:hypothetical protein
LQLDRAFADDRPLMPAALGRLQVAENPLQQAALENAIRLRRQTERAAVPLQPLPLGHLANVVLDHPLQLFELLHIGRLGKLF